MICWLLRKITITEKNVKKTPNLVAKNIGFVPGDKHTKNKGRNTYKGFLPFFEKPGAITTTPHITAAAL